MTTKFCPDCGAAPVAAAPRVPTCPHCGVEVTTKFCPDCGAAPDTAGTVRTPPAAPGGASPAPTTAELHPRAASVTDPHADPLLLPAFEHEPEPALRIMGTQGKRQGHCIGIFAYPKTQGGFSIQAREILWNAGEGQWLPGGGETNNLCQRDDHVLAREGDDLVVCLSQMNALVKARGRGHA